MERSGVRGRGGAAYPDLGRNGAICAGTESDARFVIANGDEGRSRVVHRPRAHGGGSARGPRGPRDLRLRGRREGQALSSSAPNIRGRSSKSRDRGSRRACAPAFSASDVLGSDFAFDVTVFPGMGSYVCGEETAMLNAIEGSSRRGAPAPAVPGESRGYPWQADRRSTTWRRSSNVPWIMLRQGAEAVRGARYGRVLGHEGAVLEPRLRAPRESSRWSSARRFVVVIEEAGGGGRDGKPLAAVLLGGPMGSVLRVRRRGTCRSATTAMAQRGIQLGHGGIVAVPQRRRLRRAPCAIGYAFMRDESCGKCVPCGIGSRRAADLANKPPPRRCARRCCLRLCDVMHDAQLCAHSGSSCRGPFAS